MLRRLLAARARPGAVARRASRRRRCAVRGDLHVGHRGHAEGRDAHRAHDQLQRSLRPRRERTRPRRRRVGAEPHRPLDRAQFRRAPRPLLRVEARAAGPLGRGARRRAHRGGTLFVHARRDHVPHRSRRCRGAVRSRRVVAHAVRLRWRSRAARDRARRRRRRHQRAPHLRPHRGARRELEPRVVTPREAHAHRRPRAPRGRAPA